MSYNPVKARERLLKRYGLKPEDYARLFMAQDGKCKICRRPPSPRRMLDIDHDHKPPYEVRGLLCFLCNKGLGYFSAVAALNVSDYIYGRGHDDGSEYTGYFVPKRKRRRT